MKKFFLICGILCFSFSCFIIYWKKEPQIHQEIMRMKKGENLPMDDSIRKHAEDGMINALPTLVDDYDAWYTKYHVIAHGGGGINGKEITNSHEALDEHYKNGTRLFDVDILCTADSVLVLRHSWGDNTEQDVFQQVFRSRRVFSDNLQQEYISLDYPPKMDLRHFTNHMIFGMFHPMTVDNLFEWMKGHPDAYIFPDIKEQELISRFVNEAQNAGLDTLMSHLIIRIYDYDHYHLVRKILPANQIMLKYFNMANDTYANVLKFCTNNQIHAVALSVRNADDDILNSFKEKGIHVFVAVVDHLSDYVFFREKGASGIVSNWLYEKQVVGDFGFHESH